MSDWNIAILTYVLSVLIVGGIFRFVWKYDHALAIRNDSGEGGGRLAVTLIPAINTIAAIVMLCGLFYKGLYKLVNGVYPPNVFDED